MRALALLCFVATAAGAHEPVATALGPAVDLTHPFDADTIYWPTEEGFVLERGSAGRTEAGYWYEAHRMRARRARRHAPRRAGALPRRRQHGGARVAHAPDRARRGGGRARGVRERTRTMRCRSPTSSASRPRMGASPTARRCCSRPASARAGRSVRGTSGPTSAAPPPSRSSTSRGSTRTPRAGSSRTARLAAVGLDTASIDPGRSKLFESHQILFAAEIPAFENLAYLDHLPATGATLIALPMKIAGGSGAPLRAVAILPAAR